MIDWPDAPSGDRSDVSLTGSGSLSLVVTRDGASSGRLAGRAKCGRPPESAQSRPIAPARSRPTAPFTSEQDTSFAFIRAGYEELALALADTVKLDSTATEPLTKASTFTLGGTQLDTLDIAIVVARDLTAGS